MALTSDVISSVVPISILPVFIVHRFIARPLPISPETDEAHRDDHELVPQICFLPR
jgi:hypothetical protein